MKIVHSVAPILAALLVGCATPAHTRTASLNLPKGAEVVGGGLSVDWDAPRDGTAILMEVSSGKVIRTESLKAGDRFSFNAINDDSTTLLNRLFQEAHAGAESNLLLALPADAKFVLYFVPNK